MDTFLLHTYLEETMPNQTKIMDHSIRDILHMIREKQVSPNELLDEAYQNIHQVHEQLNAFITIQEKERAVREIQKHEQDHAVFFGLPYSLKDAYCTKDIRTTSASAVLQDFTPPYSATVYEKLQHTGAVLVGKNNQDAWGHGGSTENTDFGPTKNPWNLSCIPGGSSGGSAVAISTRMVLFSIGEDTGGSIRSPASMCNISGLKVTYGRVSRYGTIAYASSLDTVGPMAKSVDDLAFVLKEIAGNDPHDLTSSPLPVPDYPTLIQRDVKKMRIGLPKEFFGEGLTDEVRAVVDQAIKAFERLGVEFVNVSMPYVSLGVSIYYLIAPSETSSNLARYDGIRYGQDRSNFTEETIRRILLGTYALSAGYADELYKKAQKAREILIEEYREALSHCDALLAPVTPSKPSRIGELLSDPMRNLLEDLYTVTINLAGVPSLAIPAGFSSDKLPIGIQLIGKPFDELTLLQLGNAFQQATNWHTEKPPLLEQHP